MKLTPATFLSLLAASAANVAFGDVHSQRANVRGMATVNVGETAGDPQHLASGFLYGIPIRQNQVPGHFYTEMGFNYGRSGGGSQPAPARGWVYGFDEFIVSYDLRSLHGSANLLRGRYIESICRSRFLL